MKGHHRRLRLFVSLEESLFFFLRGEDLEQSIIFEYYGKSSKLSNTRSIRNTVGVVRNHVASLHEIFIFHSISLLLSISIKMFR